MRVAVLCPPPLLSCSHTLPACPRRSLPPEGVAPPLCPYRIPRASPRISALALSRQLDPPGPAS